MTLDLDAIRARDAAADRCLTCGRQLYASDLDDPYHLLTVEECSWQRGKLRGPCEDPSAHHAYVPGGIRDELCPAEDAAQDRRALLAEVDRLRAVRLEASESHVWLEGAATERARIRAAVEDEYEKVKKSLPLAAVLAAIDRGER